MRWGPFVGSGTWRFGRLRTVYQQGQRRIAILVPVRVTLALALAALVGCSGATDTETPEVVVGELVGFTTSMVANFDQPWAMTFLPDGRLLVTEKPGRLWLVTTDGDKTEVSGVPDVAYGGQGGFGDVVLHPDYQDNGWIYLSYVEAGGAGTRGAVVERGRLQEQDGSAALTGLERIWTQTPKVTGSGHYGHRIAFSPNGYLFVSSGERQKFNPSQSMDGNLGKIVRLFDDGRVPDDNPFAAMGGVAAEVWTLGHRNPLGLAFDAEGQLWNTEMGPAGGDELNRVVAGENYGYPLVSNGDHYNGRQIPDHDTRPELRAPAAWWTPVISPAGLVIYRGDMFREWRGNALSGGLSSRSLVRIELDGDTAREAERFAMGTRIREVEEGPDGAVWLLQDGLGAELLRLTPVRD